MFGRITSLFGSKPSSPPAPGPQLAMPLFATRDAIPPGAIVAQWSALFPDQPPLSIAKQDGSGPVVPFEVNGRSLMVIQMPIPVPNDEALNVVKTSWMWQESDEAVRQHRGHAVVTTAPAKDGVDDAWSVARLSAAMLKAGAGAALYWGGAGQVHTPALVEMFAAERETPPVPLWVGVTISGESRTGPFSATTNGLAVFGHKEFEVLGTRKAIGDIRTTLLDLALYVLREGAVLEHGQTFGPSADQRWSIRHGRSKLVPGRDAIVLGIP